MAVWVIRKFKKCSFEDFEGYSEVMPNCYFNTKREALDAIKEYIEQEVKKLKAVHVPIIKEEEKLTSLFMAEKMYDRMYPHRSTFYVFPYRGVYLPPVIDKYVFVPEQLHNTGHL